MLRTFLSRVTSGLFVAVFMSCSLVYAQPATVAPAAPVPAQIKTAHKVFISNTTADGIGAEDSWKIAAATRPYDQFYAAMKSWGHYELVDSPSEADLVLEIHFGKPIDSARAPFAVSILDAKTHFTLWTVVEPMRGAIRTGILDRNLGEGMTKIIEDFKKLLGETSPAEKPAN